jgi:8-oxo-dGTP pyrophosphatase MutT (NUDIX family)
MEERSTGFVIYCLGKDKPLYLLLRSSRDGYWGLSKGNVDPGETDGQAARRELAEETGITNFERKPGFEHTITYWFTRDGMKIHKTVRYFLAKVKSREAKVSREHSELGWFTLEQAKEKIVFANLNETIEEADTFINRS